MRTHVVVLTDPTGQDKLHCVTSAHFCWTDVDKKNKKDKNMSKDICFALNKGSDIECVCLIGSRLAFCYFHHQILKSLDMFGTSKTLQSFLKHSYTS